MSARTASPSAQPGARCFPAYDIKGGDELASGEEVIETTAGRRGHTIIRYYDHSGEPRSCMVADEQLVAVR